MICCVAAPVSSSPAGTWRRARGLQVCAGNGVGEGATLMLLPPQASLREEGGRKEYAETMLRVNMQMDRVRGRKGRHMLRKCYCFTWVSEGAEAQESVTL